MKNVGAGKVVIQNWEHFNIKTISASPIDSSAVVWQTVVCMSFTQVNLHHHTESIIFVECIMLNQFSTNLVNGF